MQKKVSDIFNNNIFTIPNYQRDYAWGQKEFEDLWEDLVEFERIKNDKMGHFLGTIVVAPNSANSNIYDIIDGQQRATTIFMLRYALNFKKEKPERNINYFFDDNDKPRLIVNDDNREIFEDILSCFKSNQLNSELKVKLKTKGQKNLYEVAQSILNYISNIDNNRATSLLSAVDSMILMWLEEKDSGRAIRLFQTVNDRGVPLLLLDKLKALLILYSNKYCNGKLDNIINERFGEIFKISTQIQLHPSASSIADRDFQKNVEMRIFNYHSLGNKDIGHYSYGAEESFKKIKILLKNKVSKNEDIEKWLDDYSGDLVNFFKSFLEILKMSDNNIQVFQLLYILKINPYFYSSLVRLKMNNILDDEILRLFAQAEIFFYGFGSTNDATVYRLYEYTSSREQFINEIKNSIKKCNKGGIKDVVQALEEIYIDNYNRGKYFHYLFFMYRCQKMTMFMYKEVLNSKKYSYTIEHIIPQNASENGSFEQYGFTDLDNFNFLKNSFGNLLVLEPELNSSNKDNGLVIKQENYKKSKIIYNQEFASLENFLEFNKTKIEEENKKFVEWSKVFFSDFLD